MTGLQLVLDAELAPHLIRALDAHVRWCRDNAISVPDGLAEALQWSKVVQGGLSAPDGLTEAHDAPVAPLLLSLPEVAELLNGSVSTVKRMIDDGELPTVDFRGKRRIRRADLEAYVDSLGPGGSFRDRVSAKAAADPAASAAGSAADWSGPADRGVPTGATASTDEEGEK